MVCCRLKNASNWCLTLILVFVGFLLFACGSGPDVVMLGPEVKIKTFPHPVEQTKEQSRAHNSFQQAKTYGDLLETDRIIRFEVTESSAIANIDDAVYIEGFWFIADRTQKTVFQFDDQGRFIRQVGRHGQGPGEFGGASGVQRVFDSCVGITDSFLGRVHVFDLDGNHIKSTPAYGELNYFIRDGFIWESFDRLYVAALDSRDPDAHYHLAVNPNGWETIFGFGRQKKRPLPVRFAFFQKVGDEIWTGHPLNAEIEIFDMTGRNLGTISANHEDALSIEDVASYEGKHIDHQERQVINRDFLSKKRNMSLFQVGSFVFVHVGGVAQEGLFLDVYDLGGNLVRKNLRWLKVFPPVDSFDDFAVSVIPEMPSYQGDEMVSFLQNWMGEQTFGKLKEAGWEPAKMMSDNPYLRVDRLKFE